MPEKVRELVAICPGCLTWETVWFMGDVMEPKRRFARKPDGKVYHDCKMTDKPCRLYPRFVGERNEVRAAAVRDLLQPSETVYRRAGG